jgi:hypothetical protein
MLHRIKTPCARHSQTRNTLVYRAFGSSLAARTVRSDFSIFTFRCRFLPDPRLHLIVKAMGKSSTSIAGASVLKKTLWNSRTAFGLDAPPF